MEKFWKLFNKFFDVYFGIIMIKISSLLFLCIGICIIFDNQKVFGSTAVGMYFAFIGGLGLFIKTKD